MQPYIELIRRVLAVCLMLCGIWCVVIPGPDMLVIELRDFEESFNNDPYFKSKDTTLESFKADKLGGRTYEVSFEEWRAIFQPVKNGLKGNANQVFRNGHAYWLKDVPQYDTNWPSFIYLNPIGTDDYYAVNRQPPLDIYGIDRSKVYPNRRTGLLFIVASFFIYLLLPRAKRLPSRIYYKKAASVTIPDWLGLIGATFFFTLPILVIANNEPGAMPWDPEGGWWIITVAMWFLSSLFLSMVFIANHYSTLWFEITSSGLLINRGSKTTHYSWTDMESCEPYVGTAGRKIGILLILFGRSPGQVGQGLLVASNEAYGVQINLRDKRKLKIMANYLPEFSNILESLETHKIKGSEDLKA